MPFPVDRAFIERAEQQLGRSLPKAFVQHLLSTNGGEVEAAGRTWMIHPVFDDSDRKRLRRTANHLVREAEAARRWCGFPQDALAIADGEGDRLVLLPDGDRFGDTVCREPREPALGVPRSRRVEREAVAGSSSREALRLRHPSPETGAQRPAHVAGVTRTAEETREQ